MIPLAAMALLALQDPAQTGRTLVQELRNRERETRDTEERLRLREILSRMSKPAGRALCGEDDTLEGYPGRVYELSSLTLRPRDSWSCDFWRWPLQGVGPLMGVFDGIEEPPTGAIDEELLLEALKALTIPGQWDSGTSLIRLPAGKLFLVASPALHRRVARILDLLRRERLPALRFTFTLLASEWAPGAGRSIDERLGPGDLEGRGRPPEEKGAPRPVASLELSAQADQWVSAFSGVKRPVAMTVDADGPVAGTVADGLAAQVWAVPSGEQVSIRVILSYTRVLGIDEIATAKGTLRVPRLAEARVEETRTLPIDQTVVLGQLGPLPKETGLPPRLTVVARVSREAP